ncbi:hypothetical protein H5410_027522 [Solanum commersonii]|uniref:Uncharacterized protein n=1 Tax=Solanum commersonii TaxID=4109 RepID=A0A9J5Z4P9_SOLCO|nr:hypothetical protein H5410_027522 [Solanum commersonii]
MTFATLALWGQSRDVQYINKNDLSVATDGPFIGRKLNNSKLSSFLPTNDPSVAVDGPSIGSKLNNNKLSIFFQQMTHLLQ